MQVTSIILLLLFEDLNSFSNPFENLDPSTPLRNISNGQATNEVVTADLLSFSSKGENAARKFKELYVEDPKNIEKPIPRTLVKNCASSIASSQRNREEKKLVVTKCTLDAFGRILHMAAINNKQRTRRAPTSARQHPFGFGFGSEAKKKKKD